LRKFWCLAGLLPLLSIPGASWAQPAQGAELGRLKAEAARVSIVRDDWGIAHVHGKTDADAVFGAVYAQAEDDFGRVESNYLTALGRTAEAQGEGAIWQDLRQRLWIDPEALKADYASSPPWLKALMDAWADGLNFYLASHPAVHPKVLTHFEPWMALSFTEGSIGGDIERVDLKALQAFYDGPRPTAAAGPVLADNSFHEPSGSNGIAIAPSNTTGGHALLLINPHTSFFFRSELQMTSDEGLNAYGASTWGQFFIYQGFNDKAGWMHTTSGVDAVDEFLETVSTTGGKTVYRYGPVQTPMTTAEVTIRYRTESGALSSRSFTVYKTRHGPITRMQDGKWVAMALMNTPVAALEQSFLRTKQHDYASFTKIAELKANSSNNTVFADSRGEIALLTPQFIPKRDDRFDYTRPVDGADPATDWQGLHPLEQDPHLLDPKSGWLFNVNDWPYSAAGAFSPKQADFPRYMDTAGENPRGVHAGLLLNGRRDFTLDGLLKAAFDPYMPAFAELIPSLAAAYDRTPDGDPVKARLADQIALLRGWDRRWGADSVATSLAVFWGEDLWNSMAS
jgi:acyl-homoserine-lactone acylase